MKTQSMIVFLPKEKQTDWFNDIKDELASTKIKTDRLESLIGNLNNTEHVILPARYFLDFD